MKKTEEYKYECINCNFKTRDKKDYNRHLKTKKHTKHIIDLILECSCGKI